ncbi:MAG: DNA methyltransferase, partial [Thermoleophilia bacterium]|nr:DNA methyltransferase [Thermoleophilia bacterium]
ALLARKEEHRAADTVSVAHFWGVEKRRELAELARVFRLPAYRQAKPETSIGLPFTLGSIALGYTSWPLLDEVFPVSFPGVKTSRDPLVVDIDRDRLVTRMRAYFDPAVGEAELRQIASCAVTDSSGYNARETRAQLIERGFRAEHVVPFMYRPFDLRWAYWEPASRLLDRPRPEYFREVVDGNLWMSATQQNRKEYSPPIPARSLASLHLIERGASMFPLTLLEPVELTLDSPQADGPRPNLSPAAAEYLAMTCADALGLFLHSLALMHAPSYAVENSSALRLDWPRIPLPNTKDLLLASAELGRTVADLLDPETDVDGVTTGVIRPEMKVIGVATRVGGGNLDPQAGDLAVTAGWGHAGQGGVTMPGKGKIIPRPYTPEERAAIEQGAEALGVSAEEALDLLGDQVVDVYLNDVAYWRCMPAKAWSYTIGGYQVMKKWLSYREKALLGRDLKPEEVREVMRMARRIAAILLLQPALDANYRAVKGNAYEWGAQADGL